MTSSQVTQLVHEVVDEVVGQACDNAAAAALGGVMTRQEAVKLVHQVVDIKLKKFEEDLLSKVAGLIRDAGHPPAGSEQPIKEKGKSSRRLPPGLADEGREVPEVQAALELFKVRSNPAGGSELFRKRWTELRNCLQEVPEALQLCDAMSGAFEPKTNRSWRVYVVALLQSLGVSEAAVVDAQKFARVTEEQVEAAVAAAPGLAAKVKQKWEAQEEEKAQKVQQKREKAQKKVKAEKTVRVKIEQQAVRVKIEQHP